MEAAEFHVGDASLIDVIEGGNSGVELTERKAKVDIHRFLISEAMAGSTHVRHIKGILYEGP
jgi:hypothetical protein